MQWYVESTAMERRKEDGLQRTTSVAASLRWPQSPRRPRPPRAGWWWRRPQGKFAGSGTGVGGRSGGLTSLKCLDCACCSLRRCRWCRCHTEDWGGREARCCIPGSNSGSSARTEHCQGWTSLASPSACEGTGCSWRPGGGFVFWTFSSWKQLRVCSVVKLQSWSWGSALDSSPFRSSWLFCGRNQAD